MGSGKCASTAPGVNARAAREVRLEDNRRERMRFAGDKRTQLVKT
jgi:hypothetical protein